MLAYYTSFFSPSNPFETSYSCSVVWDILTVIVSRIDWIGDVVPVASRLRSHAGNKMIPKFDYGH